MDAAPEILSWDCNQTREALEGLYAVIERTADAPSSVAARAVQERIRQEGYDFWFVRFQAFAYCLAADRRWPRLAKLACLDLSRL